MTVTIASTEKGRRGDLVVSTAATGVPTKYAVYVRTKGKRTYERVALTADFAEASQAHRLRGQGGDALEVMVDAGYNPPVSFPSTDYDNFQREMEGLRADSRVLDAAAIIDQIEVGQDVDCGLDDGMAFALHRIWNEQRADEGRGSIRYSFALFAGKPRRWGFHTMSLKRTERSAPAETIPPQG